MSSTISPQVVILAAGKGTRMQSTKAKVLHQVGHKALINHVIDVSKSLNAKKIIVVLGHEKDQVAEAIASHDVITVEQKQMLGTGHAVMSALPELDSNSPVLVLLGDTPLIPKKDILSLMQIDAAISVMSMHQQSPTGYGRIVRDENDEMLSIIEQKDASEEQKKINECNTGVMVFEPGFLQRHLQSIKTQNAAAEYYLTDLIGIAAQNNKTISATSCSNAKYLAGVNCSKDLAQLEGIYRSLRANELMDRGVSLQDPARIDISGEINVGHDVYIEADVELIGPLIIGDNVVVSKGCVLKNCSIGNSTLIKAYTLIEDSIIAENVQLGPFARIRPGTHVHNDAKIGNFVETKKSIIGVGSKVSHLSYIGDAELGKDVNIGAGTITCNYDGVNKSKTIIHDDAFVGSNSALVAPVTIGEKATIGAGSVITTEAEAGKLTLTRVKQKTFSGWQRPQKK